MRNDIADSLLDLIEEVKHDLFRMDDDEVSRHPAPGKWSPKQVMGHLIDSALNNHQRIVRAQEAEHTVLPGYEQEFWVNANAYQERRWEEILTLFNKFNRFLAEVIRKVPRSALSNRLTIGGGEPVTLEFILEDYLRHVRHHLTQIRPNSK